MIRKMTVIWLILIFLIFPCGIVSAGAENKSARQVKLTVTCSDRSQDVRKILDNKEKTKLKITKRTTFTVKSDDPFRILYLKFEKECDWFITLPDGKKISGGDENYIHKYISLDGEISSFRLTMPIYSGLTDIYAFTDGETPDWVQIWQPPCEKADLMVMPTHADDEFLWFGGAMPYYAGELGYDVQVVYLTNHNNATIRNHERLNGLWTVGVRHYPVISRFLDVNESRYGADGAAKVFGYKKVMAYQVGLVRRFKPRVILAQDINGEYGHGAHKLNAQTILEAVRISDDPKQYPESAKEYGTYQVEKCYLHLWKENQITVSWSDKILSRFGGKSALDMAKEGFDCHKSQVISVKVEEKGPYDCRKFGLAYTTVGVDTPGTNDLFEHIDMSDKNTGVGSSSEGSNDESSNDESGNAEISGTDNETAPHTHQRHEREITVSAIIIVSIALVCFLFNRLKRRDRTKK